MGPDLLRADLAEHLPWFGLRVAHQGLVLAPPTDVELLELAPAVAEPGGILSEGEDTFVTWPTGTPEAAVSFLRFHWGLRVPAVPGRWLVPFAIELDGRTLGIAVLETTPDAGTVATRSWLVRTAQGAGTGRQVRLMLLELAFAHLGAERALTAAAVGNAASIAVSRRCGYRETERGRGPDGVEEIRFALTRGAWRRRRLPDVTVRGVAPFLAALGS